jgi:glutathione S-transferase
MGDFESLFCGFPSCWFHYFVPLLGNMTFTLYSVWLSPPCRKVWFACLEKEIAIERLIEKPWERRSELFALNPAGQVPVLSHGEQVICDSNAIVEYLDDVHREKPLLGLTALQKAEVRRLMAWFDGKFAREVTQNLLDEKVFKRLFDKGNPNSSAIRAGAQNIHYHLEYIGYLVERRNWLAGELFSLADITAAAHLSCLDYIGAVPWEQHEQAKNWYMRLKSRRTFRPILQERMPSVQPALHYARLDF